MIRTVTSLQQQDPVGSDAVTAEADFLADPVEFMKNNIIRPIIHDFSASIQNSSLRTTPPWQ
jgi:hypothetical protein